MNQPSPQHPSDAACAARAADAAALARSTAWLAAALACGALGVVALQLLAAQRPGGALADEWRRSGVAGLLLAALTAAAGGALAAWVMARARRSGQPGRAARWPQALILTPLALVVPAGAAWPLAAARPDMAASATGAGLCAALLLAAAFPLLLAERMLAAPAAARLPEAADLRGLLLAATLAAAASAALEVAAGLGAPALAVRLAALLSLLPSAMALEMALRAAGRCFLPAPADDAARAVGSRLARRIAMGRGGARVPAVLRQLAPDLTRSWALAFSRAAILPLGLALAALAWALSGVALLRVDQRAVYERFGAPVAVLPPGLHLVLPWPLGRVRSVELGVVHEIGLLGDTSTERLPAEAPPPPSTDRLWDTPHPNEASFLTAATREGKPSFHLVNADIRLIYRVGPSDADAIAASYGVVDAPALLRRMAMRAVAAHFAGRTLDAVLVADRDRMARELRLDIQAALSGAGTGLELAALVINTLHPPSAVADAYHAVQAAQINAEASVTQERGRAHGSIAAARLDALALASDAPANAAERLSAARADATRFGAERAALAAAGGAFALERRLARLVSVLGGTELVVLDHRIPASSGLLLDLRPPPGDAADAIIGKP
jgi:regulator of protease activity HflC (stomatin/prohibitin superfamily)